jgi:DNA methylase/ParB/Sulfiredoxin domain
MKTELSIKYLATEELTPYARNSRTHTGEQIRQVANSIRKFGWMNPVIIDEHGMIIAGHARVLAAKQIGLKIIPVIRVNHLTEDEKRAYILADNKIAANAGWDESLLRVELEHLARIDVDVDVDLTGFSTPEIDFVLAATGDVGEAEPPPPPLPDIERTVTVPGDNWQLGPHRIACGDCRDRDLIDRLMGDNRAQTVITDMPYNVVINGHVCGSGKHQHGNFLMGCGEMSKATFTTFATEGLGQLAYASLDGSVHYVFMDWRHLDELMAAGDVVYDRLLNVCVWVKTNGGMGSLYRSQHEMVLVYKKGTAPHVNNVELGKHGRYRTNVWTYAGMNTFGAERDAALAMHPTVKPVRLVADAILDVTHRGNIVLDGFLGSGTTILAAEQTGRIGYGVEIDPRYVDVALRRWMDATGGTPIHADSGMTFDELAAARGRDAAREA